MIVCVCRRVSDQQIRRAAAYGAATLEDLQVDLGVATGCGRCAECACEVLAEANGRASVVAWMPRAGRAALQTA